VSTYDDTRWANVTLADILVSLQVPHGWDAFPEEFGATLRAPVEAEVTPTVTLQVGEPEQPGLAWWRDFTEQVVGHLIDTAPGFSFVDQDEFRLSSLGAEVYVVRGHWESDDPTLPETAQLQAWIWAGSTRMYQVSAVTSLQHEDRDLPVFEHLLRSIRLLPERP